MKRVEVEIPDFIGGKLIKDLQDDEVICEHCKGTGLRIEDNVYGIQGEHTRELFPYKHQSISFCQYCYNGIQHKCLHCGKIIPRERLVCDCEASANEQLLKAQQAMEKIFEKAEKVSYEEYTKRFPGCMVFDPFKDEYYSDLDSLIEAYEDEEESLPKYVYGTTLYSIDLDIDNAIENACEDLFEDADDRLVGIDDLKAAVEKFNERNKKITATYYSNQKIAILIS